MRKCQYNGLTEGLIGNYFLRLTGQCFSAVKDSEKEEKSIWAPICNKDQKQPRGKNQGGTINIHQVPIML